MLRFCVVVAATGAFIMIALYVFAGQATTVSFVNLRVVVQTTADYLFPILLQTFVVSTIVVGLATLLIMLFVSHRIAGPAYRFKKVLETLSGGDFSIDCRIRSKDSLKDVAAAFNDMISGVREKLRRMDSQIKDLKEKLDGGEPREIKRTVSELEKSLHHFKF